MKSTYQKTVASVVICVKNKLCYNVVERRLLKNILMILIKMVLDLFTIT